MLKFHVTVTRGLFCSTVMKVQCSSAYSSIKVSKRNIEIITAETATISAGWERLQYICGRMEQSQKENALGAVYVNKKKKKDY